MVRLRYDGVATTLGASLTNSATSVTLAAALTHDGGTNVPTITGTDYIPLTILDSNGKVSEVVYLTAYTAAATTGTISRGQEGTTGVSHNNGDVVVAAPTVHDFPVYRVKGSDESVSASTTLQDDNELTFPIGANETWVVNAYLSTGGSAAGAATADIKFNWSVPAGATGRQFILGYAPTAAGGATTTENYVKSQSFALGTALTGGVADPTSATNTHQFYGTIINSSTAGNVTLQWAQAVSNAASTTVHAGSYLVAHRVS